MKSGSCPGVNEAPVWSCAPATSPVVVHKKINDARVRRLDNESLRIHLDSDNDHIQRIGMNQVQGSFAASGNLPAMREVARPSYSVPIAFLRISHRCTETSVLLWRENEQNIRHIFAIIAIIVVDIHYQS